MCDNGAAQGMSPINCCELSCLLIYVVPIKGLLQPEEDVDGAAGRRM